MQTALITLCVVPDNCSSIFFASALFSGFPKTTSSIQTMVSHVITKSFSFKLLNADAFCFAIYKAISLPFKKEGYSSFTFAGLMVKFKPKSVKNCFLRGEFEANKIGRAHV